MNTLVSAHQRLDRLEPKVDQLEKDVASVKAEVHFQFKEVFVRVKRLEHIMIVTAGTIIMLLVSVLFKMG